MVSSGSEGKVSAAKLHSDTLVLPNNVGNTDDYVFATDDLTNGDYEKKPKENYADISRKALEENDSSSDEEIQRDDAVKENVQSMQMTKGTTKKLSQERRKKLTVVQKGVKRRGSGSLRKI